MDTVFRPYNQALIVGRDGSPFRLREFFGRSTDAQFGPEAFLVEQPPGVTNGAHFHEVDQYQVFFSSPGATYQRQPITSVMLHYADAYSTYGPFRSGPTEALRFFTLRAQPSSVHGDMPGARDKLLYQGRRQRAVDLAPFLADPPADGCRVVIVIPAEDDGLAAHLATLAPRAALTLPAATDGTGRYYCVLSGEPVVDGERLDPYSLGWSTQGGTALTLSTGEGACALLVLDFPFPATPEAHRLAS